MQQTQIADYGPSGHKEHKHPPKYFIQAMDHLINICELTVQKFCEHSEMGTWGCICHLKGLEKKTERNIAEMFNVGAEKVGQLFKKKKATIPAWIKKLHDPDCCQRNKMLP